MAYSGTANLTPIGRIGRFDVLGKLAVGGMAEIFLARESGPAAASREVVLKRILPHIAADPQLRAMFVHEARLCLRLRHPSICPIYEFGDQEGSFFIAMEWIHGVSLRNIIAKARNQSGLRVDLGVQIIADVAAALHYAHTATDEHGLSLGIVHRDVTPENIMVSFDGATKLLDFGIAKASTQIHKTQPFVVKGKFAYMSPEQYRGTALDGRSDIFSLGACLFEVLTGRGLFDRNSEFEIVAAIVLENETPSACAIRPDLPEAVDGILRRALAKDREERFGTADEMQGVLLDFLARNGYSVRASQTSALLRSLFAEEFLAGPKLDRSATLLRPSRVLEEEKPLLPVAARLAVEAEIEEAEDHFVGSARRKRAIVGILIALVVLGTLAACVYALRQEPPSAAAHEDAVR